ncbi:MAG: thioesterase [Bacteroidales bacterium]|nr:thioesterase [Bacteroidales bacterium]
MQKIKLFCFPYAGGSSSIYAKWDFYLYDFIKLFPVELAGRGSRIDDPVYKSYDNMIDDILNRIHEEISSGFFAFFGHSMGALIAFSLAQRIAKEKLNEPVHIFFSGQEAPHFKINSNTKKHTLPDSQFLEEIIKMGGLPDKLIDNKEFLNFFLPVLKNDFKLDETFTLDNQEPLNTNFSVLTGRNDSITYDEIVSWNKYSSKFCNVQYFNGNHFFIEQSRNSVISFVNDTLFKEKRIRRID